MYLLDSDVCIEIMRGNCPHTWELMRASSPSIFGIPAIVEAELRFGAQNSMNPSEGTFAVERFLSALSVIPFDSHCAVQYATIRADLKQRGCMIGPNDLLIAATALATSSTLISNNIREFKRVRGLKLECWEEVNL